MLDESNGGLGDWLWKFRQYADLDFWTDRARRYWHSSFDDKDLNVDEVSFEEQHFPLGELLPYRWFDDRDDIYHNRNSFGFVLEVSPLIGADMSTVGTLTSLVSETLPKNCSVQYQLLASPRIGPVLEEWYAPRQKAGGLYREIGRRRCDFISTGVFKRLYPHAPYVLRRHRCYISVSLPGFPEEHTLRQLYQIRDAYDAGLDSLGLARRRLKPLDFLRWVDELVHPKMDIYSPELEYNPLQPLNEQLTDPESEMLVRRRDMILGENFRAINFSVRKLPEHWAQWQNQKLLGDPEDEQRQFETPYVQHFTVTAGDDMDAANMAAFKAARATQRADDYEFAKYFSYIKQKKRDWDFVNRHLKAGQKLGHGFYGLTIFSRPGFVDVAERQARGVYGASGWRLARDSCVQLQNFLSMLPFMPSEGLTRDLKRMKRMRTMVSFTSANLAPMQGEYTGNGSPCMLLAGRRGELILWDPFANTEGNYNAAFIGKSGSGKSVALNEFFTSCRGRGDKVIILDDGRSFEKNVILQGGAFVEFTFRSGICINPFSMIDAGSAEEDRDYASEGLGMINKIVCQMARDGEKLDAFERGLIEAAVLRAWEAKGTDANIGSVIELLSENEDQRAKDLVVMLGKYGPAGIYGSFFNGKANLRLDNDLICFELAELKDKKELQQNVIFILMFLTSEAMYRGQRKQRFVLGMDEAWSFLTGDISADFVEAFTRRCRKYNGMLATGTQSVNDYFRTPGATAAYENSDWVVLLAQKPESIDALKNSGRVSVDQHMERELKSLRMVDRVYSEMLIYGPRGYHVGRLFLDSFSAALYSSKGEDYNQVRELVASGKTLEEAVSTVAAKIDEYRKRS